jgi:hypothetical protein
MKQIIGLPIWYNGDIKLAEIIEFHCVDNLFDKATINYRLFDINLKFILASGSIEMETSDYNLFNNNEYAFEFICNKLSIQFN